MQTLNRSLRQLGWGVFVGCLLTVVFSSMASAGMSKAIHRAKHGYIAARGLVLTADGRPIWAEYDHDRNILWQAEAGDLLEEAMVVSAAGYQSLVDNYRALIAERGDQLQTLYIDEYESLYGTYSGASYAFTLVVDNSGVVLLSSPIDLKRIQEIPESANSILLGSDRQVVRTSEGTFAFRTAFYTPKDQDGNAVGSGENAFSGYDPGTHTLWGPIRGARVTTALSDYPAFSDEEGHYAVGYVVPPSPGTIMTYSNPVMVELRFLNFNPKATSPFGYWYMSLPSVDSYNGIGDINLGCNTLACAIQALKLKEIGSAYIPDKVRFDFPVDVTVLVGQAVMMNDQSPESLPNAELLGAIALQGQTQYAYTPPPNAPMETDPNKVTDLQPDFSDQGLLAGISRQDLADTDIYVFRLSDDQLIAAREGMGENSDSFSGGDLSSEDQALIDYRMLMYGPNNRGAAEQVLPEGYEDETGNLRKLSGRNWDFAHMGEKVKVILINRSTGYVGSSIAEIGTLDVTSETGATQETLLNFVAGAIYMRPPNLKIKAQRYFEVDQGMTAGEEKSNIIGFEGSGLTSDKIITITTEWYDWDGQPLPATLPGYTGRLAKVVQGQFQGRYLNQIANFNIRPGRSTQLVQLPEEGIDNAHFYIHVSAEPITGNPLFTEDGSGPGPLAYRPGRYVPVKVPVFDQNATRANAALQLQALIDGWQDGQPVPVLENIAKVYRWPYRPELQFSLFDLQIDPIEMLTEFNETTGAGNTSLTFTYDLGVNPVDPLDRLGMDRQLVFGVGYAEILALLGQDQQAVFPSLEALQQLMPAQQIAVLADAVDALQAEDFLGLQLYQNDDAGNQLMELYGLPLMIGDAVEPFVLARNNLNGQFDANLPGSLASGYIDSYRPFRFNLVQPSDVAVRLLDENQQALAEIVAETRLSAGPFNFMLDYETVAGAGVGAMVRPAFYVELSAKAVDGSRNQKILYPGRLRERQTGKILGQIMAHDVLIQDGSLNLVREDFSLQGRGPALNLSRTYSNQPPGEGPHPLGPGWRHSLDMRLRPLATVAQLGHATPSWVTGLLGRFFRNSEISADPDEWGLVSVNGTLFIKHNAQWYAERGRHGVLTEGTEEFIFTAKDGTRYYYDIPRRAAADNPPDPLSLPGYVSIADGMFYRIAASPAPFEAEQPVHPAAPIQPTRVKRIVDRNGNQMTFTYGVLGLERVTDAVGRELVFENQVDPVRSGSPAARLHRVTGPGGLEVVFSYNVDGLLERVQRDSRTETYAYELEAGGQGLDYNLARTTDSNDHSYRYEYYNIGEVHSSLDAYVKALKAQDVVHRVYYPDNNFARFAYDAQTDNLRTVTDLRGYDTRYYLNYYGNPVRIEAPLGRTTRMTWSIDEGGDDNVMTSKTDARGFITTYQYDNKGNITLETDPYDHTITTTWDPEFSQPLSRMDRNGITQEWTYDDDGNLRTYTDGDGKIYTYSYYTTGERRIATTPRGFTTTYTYDQNGNPDTVQTPEGSLTDYTYDVRGRKTHVQDPNGNITQYTYDSLDYPDQVILPLLTAYDLPTGSSRSEDFDFDAEGNLLRQTDRLGLVLTYTYTSRDQVETVTSSGGGVRTFGYDDNGNLASETDWKGVATTHTYDELNRRDSTTNRLGHTMTMGYDDNGNLTRIEDYAQRVSTFEYDRLNRQTDIHLPDLDGEPVHLVKTYYDEADPETNLHTETDAEGNTTTYAYNGRYLRTSRVNALLDEYTWAYDDNGNLERETDEEQNYVRYVYDRQDRQTDAYRSLERDQAIVEIHTVHKQYDAAGNLRYATDANNHTVEVQFDQWNRAFRTIAPGNFVNLVHLDGNGNKVYERDANQGERHWQYDPRGLLLTYTDAQGHSTSYTYDLNENTETVTNANGNITRTSYDAEDREQVVTEALGTADERSREVVARDNMGNPLQVRDFNGNLTTYTYNGFNLVERTYDPAPFEANYTEKKYYRTGKLLSARNRRGFTTTFHYDALNRLTRGVDPLDQSVTTTYDRVGNTRTVTDKRNIVTESFYDDFYRLVRTDRDGIRLVSNEYDDAGNLTAVVDAENHRTQYAYNNRNLLETTTFADNTTRTRTYDGVGNLATLTDEQDKVTTYLYDRENRRTAVTFAGETTSHIYDPLGNLLSVTTPEGTCTINAYDRLNRLVRVIADPTTPTAALAAAGGFDPRFTKTDGLNLTTRYEYDANGNLRRQYDARDNQVEYTYDALNRKTAHIQHKTGGNLTVQYTQYDANGNLRQMVDAMGRTFTYTYDELDRETDRSAPDIDTPLYQTTLVHTDYDLNNNITGITETKIREDDTSFTETTVNTFDNFDRLETTTQRGLLTSYGYDNNGNRTSVTTPAGSTTYTYDVRNRLETAVADGGTTTYTYRGDGLKERVTYPNNTQTDYTYTGANRIETITHTRSADSSVISSYSYTYDHNGNRTGQTEVQNGATETTGYDYDALDRLTQYTVTGTDTIVTAYTFESYNRKTETVTTNGTVTRDRTYTYDESDWLTVIDDTTDSGNPYTIAYTYDNNGNTLTKRNSSLTNQDETFVYNALDQMVETRRGPPSSETVLGRYDYNAAGLRIRHRLSGRGDVDYYYDGDAVIEEHNAADDSLLGRYRYADRLISLDTGAAKQYYHHDALGSTVNLTTPAAAVQVAYKLDPWGHIRDQQGTSVNRQIFTGQEHDENTGLIYFGARYYDPDTARFITQDTYLGQTGTPPSLHRYLYAYSNPTVFFDPTGHAPVTKEITDILGNSREALEGESTRIARKYGRSSLPVTATLALVRTLLSIGEGIAGAVNYTSNWGIVTFVSQPGKENAEWVLESFLELQKTHSDIGNAVSYLRTSHGRAEVKDRILYNIGGAMVGDPECVGNVTAFVGEIYASKGLASLSKKATSSAVGMTYQTVRRVGQTTRTAVRQTTKQILAKTRSVATITGEFRKGLTRAGRKIVGNASTSSFRNTIGNNIGTLRIDFNKTNLSKFADDVALSNAKTTPVLETSVITDTRLLLPGPKANIIGASERTLLLPKPKTATAWRNTPGTVLGKGVRVHGDWLKKGMAGHVPEEVARVLRGRHFNTFSEFQTAFWEEVGKFPHLLRQFGPRSQAEILAGRAPFALRHLRTGRGRSQIKYNLHHKKPISEGGAVYDIDNILVASPKYHTDVFH